MRRKVPRLLLLGWCLLPLLAVPAQESATLFKDKEMVFEFPKDGIEQKVKFAYTNLKTHPIRIQDVKFSCGCVGSSITSFAIAPGESGEFEVKIDTSKFQAKGSRKVILLTDDPEEKLIELTVWAAARELVEVWPDSCFWSSAGKLQAKMLRISSRKGINVDKMQVSSTSPGFTSSLQKSQEGGWKLYVRPTSGTAPIAGKVILTSFSGSQSSDLAVDLHVQ